MTYEMAVATIPVFSWVRDVPRTPTSPLAELLHPRMQELSLKRSSHIRNLANSYKVELTKAR